MFDMNEMDICDFEEDDFDTIMAPDISFRGTIRFRKPFMIRGKVSGSIDAKSDLVIDTGALVFSDIGADRVVVRGNVKGNIDGRRIVVVTATGDVSGNITARQVVLEPGSTFSGRCTMLK
ncbi:MAG: polymer-forming cytoskeletal protein [Treponema sp.]|jgi:cytoskeletal protein CcmA (bactofilin family)|nr:polymer-forming cytoskeletal protein [Treponema sp.]